jgi:excisionase family DNA binding protein
MQRDNVDQRESPDLENQLLTVAEVARRLRLSPKTIRRLERRGGLPSRRYGRALRFDRTEVMAAGKRG